MMTRTLASRAALFATVFSATGSFAYAQTAGTTTPAATNTPPAPAAAAAAPATVTLNGPPMTAPLAFEPVPFSFDAGPLGKVYAGGVLTALGLVQNNHALGTTVGSDFTREKTGWADISNAQVFLQKIDGMFQFYVQVGAYSYPAIGTAYLPSRKWTDANYGVVPVAYGKIALSDTFSISAGKMITLVGAEYVWSFENINIERGLLTNQEQGVGHAVQANYTVGPVALALQYSDGYYSDRYNWLTGSAAWTINPKNSLSVVAQGNLGSTGAVSGAAGFPVPTALNNSSLFDVIYTYTNAPILITVLGQYINTAKNPGLGINVDGSSYGVAVLGNYTFDEHFSLGARAEYLGSDGSAALGGPNLTFYGAGSKAYSLTVTPTYQYNRYFVRAEGSYVGLSSLTSGFGFGETGTKKDQVRGLIETGVLF